MNYTVIKHKQNYYLNNFRAKRGNLPYLCPLPSYLCPLLSKSLLRKILLRGIKVIGRQIYAARVDGVVHLLLGGAGEEEDESLALDEIRAVECLLYALGIGL